MPEQLTFEIQSKIDNQKFVVSQKVIDSSAFLKNICDITDIYEQIIVPCSSESLKFYIRLINQSTNNNGTQEDVDERNNIFKSLSREKLITIIQEISYLDSDIFLDSVADYILELFEDDAIDWRDIQEYLGLEDDFTLKERKMILENNKLEYLLSVDRPDFTKLVIKMFKNYIFEPLQWILTEIITDFATVVSNYKPKKNFRTKDFLLNFGEVCRNFGFFKFPFQNKSLYSMKTDFATPMNALIARIVQRSNERTRYLLSLINKSIKNEVDRYPIMLSEVNIRRTSWTLFLNIDIFKTRFNYNLYYETFDEIYFNTLKKRKIITKKAKLNFTKAEESIIQISNFNFIICPNIVVTFSRRYNLIYDFDVTKCYSSSILYEFYSIKEEGIKFKEIYDQLIAKALSKEIRLQTSDFFNFGSPLPYLKLYKKPNASKFYSLTILYYYEIYSEFKEFVKNYMDENGFIETSSKIQGIPVNIEKDKGRYIYPVSVLKRYLESIILK